MATITIRLSKENANTFIEDYNRVVEEDAVPFLLAPCPWYRHGWLENDIPFTIVSSEGSDVEPLEVTL
jgi:hypothetical protein